jgi:hypothetical protein
MLLVICPRKEKRLSFLRRVFFVSSNVSFEEEEKIKDVS